MIELKTCSQCEESLPLDKYRVRPSGKVYAHCRTCDNLAKKAAYRAKKDGCVEEVKSVIKVDLWAWRDEWLRSDRARDARG